MCLDMYMYTRVQQYLAMSEKLATPEGCNLRFKCEQSEAHITNGTNCISIRKTSIPYIRPYWELLQMCIQIKRKLVDKAQRS